MTDPVGIGHKGKKESEKNLPFSGFVFSQKCTLKRGHFDGAVIANPNLWLKRKVLIIYFIINYTVACKTVYVRKGYCCN